MYTKNQCRDYLREVKPFINLTQVAKATNVSRVGLHNFIKDKAYNGVFSIEKLNMIVKFIQEL